MKKCFKRSTVSFSKNFLVYGLDISPRMEKRKPELSGSEDGRTSLFRHVSSYLQSTRRNIQKMSSALLREPQIWIDCLDHNRAAEVLDVK
jgi:hypothetical protein